MKNPIEPNFKTERFPIFMVLLSLLAAFYFSMILPSDLIVAFSRDGQSNQAISWTLISYIWPLVLAVVYAMFLFFPYFKINHQESAVLKEQWHEAKRLVLSFFFILQVTGMLLLSGSDKILTWALPILFILLIASLVPTIVKVIYHRKKHPIKYGK
jgi:hypothetical protein